MDFGLLIVAVILALCCAIVATGMALFALRDKHTVPEQDEIHLFPPNPPVPAVSVSPLEMSFRQLAKPKLAGPMPMPEGIGLEQRLGRVRELACGTQTTVTEASATVTGFTDRVCAPVADRSTVREQRTRRIVEIARATQSRT